MSIFNRSEHKYLRLLQNVLDYGNVREDRTGVGTRSLFGERLVLDLSEGWFPLLTTKKVHFKSVVHELLWMISGSTNVKDLQKHGVTIWDEWAAKNGDLGRTYGYQWRKFGLFNDYPDYYGVDQLSDVIEGIKTNPYSRRHIVTAWNPQDLPNQRLPPCHILFQFYVNKGELSCHLYQRSADLFLGVPFNIASYSLLTMMVAKVTGLTPGELTISYGDAHIYENHLPQVKELLDREVRKPPCVLIANKSSLFDFKYEDFTLVGYDPHPAIKAEVAV